MTRINKKNLLAGVSMTVLGALASSGALAVDLDASGSNIANSTANTVTSNDVVMSKLCTACEITLDSEFDLNTNGFDLTGADGSPVIDTSANVSSSTTDLIIFTGTDVTADTGDIAIAITDSVSRVQVRSGATVVGTGAGTGINVTAAIANQFYNSGAISTTTGIGVQFSGAQTNTFYNYSTITGVAGTGIKVTGGQLTGTIYNSGTVTTAGGTGINVNAAIDGGINNSGTISETTGVGITVGASADLITNSGTVSSVAGVAIKTTAASTTDITNSGTIKDTSTGKAIHVTTGTLTGTITNSGTISSVGGIVIDVDQEVTGGITNSSTGTILSTGNAVAIDVANTMDLSITNSGIIKGTGNAAVISYAGTSDGDIVNNSGATIQNTGTGTAITITTQLNDTGDDGGSITNAGTITAAGNHAMSIADMEGTLTNSGTISSTSTGAHAAITLAALTGSSITGSKGIYNTSTGTISTAGSVGAIVLSADADIVGGIYNAGTIKSTNGTPVAIDLSLQTTNTNTITITNTGTITGAIKLGAEDIVTNTGTITGNIVGYTGDNETVNWNGGTITGTIALGSDDGDTLNVGDAAADEFSTGGAISGLSDLNVLFGTLNIGHAITLTESQVADENFVVAADATAAITADLTINAGDIDINGTLDVQAGNKLTVTAGSTGELTFGAASTLKIGMSSLTNYGQIDFVDGGSTGNVQFTSGATLYVDVDASTYIAAAPTVLTDVVAADDIDAPDATNLSSADADITMDDNSYILSFTTAGSDATGLDITVTRANSYDDASNLTNEINVGRVLEVINDDGTTAFDTILGQLDSISTARGVESALETLTPEVNGITGASAVAAQNLALNTVSDRQIALRDADESGVAAGSKARNLGAWGQVFGTSADQDDNDGVAGYDGDTIGVSLGGDADVFDNLRVGVSASYANTSNDSARGAADIDSYQGTLYGTYTNSNIWYDGMLGFAWHNFDTKRNIAVGSVSDQAKADFDGTTVTAKLTAGRDFKTKSPFQVTPFASLQFSNLSQDSYTETGSTADLTVDHDDNQVLEGGLGVRFAYPLKANGVSYLPSLKLAYLYDFIGDEAEATSSFVNGTSATFLSKGADVDQSTFQAGVGVDIFAQDNLTLSVDYDLKEKSSYEAHTGAVKARITF